MLAISWLIYFGHLYTFLFEPILQQPVEKRILYNFCQPTGQNQMVHFKNRCILIELNKTIRMRYQVCFYHDPRLRNIDFPNLGGVNQAAATAKLEADDDSILLSIDTPSQVVSY